MAISGHIGYGAERNPPTPRETDAVVLSIAAFGATCELEDDEWFRVTRDHFTLTWQEAEAAEAEAAGLDKAEAAGLNTGAERPRRAFEWVSSPDQFPWYVRWWLAHRRPRKKRAVFGVTEFADLSDGRRVIVRSDRGWGWSWKHSPGPFYGSTPESFAGNIAYDIRDYFMQLEEDRPCSPEWVVERLQRLYGIEIDPASVPAALRAPLRVELGTRLLQSLQQ